MSLVAFFSAFINWCAGRNLNAAHYKLVFVPLNPEAERRLKQEWNKSFAASAPDDRYHDLWSGTLCGVPFEIHAVRPAEKIDV